EARGQCLRKPAVQDQLEAVELGRLRDVREDAIGMSGIVEGDADQVVDLAREVDQLPAEGAALRAAADADLEVAALLGLEVRVAGLDAVLGEVQLLGVGEPERRAN